ncbi:MAG: ribosome assembly factor SBDS [Candidatus Woesearchaeota archaeon]|nr:MAG: ribosome assembly factor SBDS [Candidatus Woesearchaeota archaeon]
MVDIDKAIIARLKVKNEKFEILVDCDKALEFKEGKSISLDEIIATDSIFKDVKKGEHASEKELKTLFGTSDYLEISKEIIKKGEIQLTAEHNKRLREEKKKQIINLLHRNGIDAKTGLPHPPQRLEAALEEARVNIDPFKKAEEQINDILKKISPIIPIKFEKRKIQVKLQPQYTTKSYQVLKRYGKLLKDEWKDDGSWLGVIEIPAGMQEELYSDLNSLTHGNVETKIIQGE